MQLTNKTRTKEQRRIIGIKKLFNIYYDINIFTHYSMEKAPANMNRTWDKPFGPPPNIFT